jgi:hypothetical protein
MTPPYWVSRGEWGAVAGKGPLPILTSAKGVKVHWIGGPYGGGDHSVCASEVRAIQQEHLTNKTQGWLDIAYNLVVCAHRYVFEARGIGKESGANGNQPLNMAHYAVCAIQGTNQPAGDDLKNGLRDAIEYLQANGAGNEILGHRDGYNTDCPGDELYNWVHAGAPRQNSPTPAPTPAPQPAPTPQPPVVLGPPFPGEYLRVQSPMLHDNNVRAWQQRMADRGWPITADGWYGPASAHVCQEFQADKGLTQDGIVGPKTWAAAWNAPLTN